MPLKNLQFKPGIVRDNTSYSNDGGWFDCDKIRFRLGFPEKIGGWVKQSFNVFLGTARAIIQYVSLSGANVIGLGTNLKYYIQTGGAYRDITPIRSTVTLASNPFTTSSGSNIVTVTDANGGYVTNDFVTFSGGSAVNGLDLNKEFQITYSGSGNTYTITADSNASGSGAGGGGSVSAAYQINVGLDTSVFGTGWGVGNWGRQPGTDASTEGWGTGYALSSASDIMRIWSHDNFGEDLLINVRNGGIFYFDKSTASATQRAVSLNTAASTFFSLTNDATCPTIAKQILVSDVDRHVIAFGCDGQTTIGTQDPLLIRFSSQEDPFTWAASSENTAGELRLGSGSEIITAVETKQGILIFTDASLHNMTYVGDPFIFGIDQISMNTSIMSPLSSIAVDDSVIWMGSQDFYIYNGRVSTIPCPVKNYVFNDFNLEPKEKATAGLNSSFSEVWWFYPSSSSTENDRYVVYNYLDQTWYFGNLSRTVWLDRGVNDYPIAASGGYLYNHEFGLNDGSVTPEVGITSHIESSQFDIEDGNRFSFVSKLIPDFTFSGSTSTTPSVVATLKSRNFPGASYLTTDPSTVTQSVAGSSTVIEQFTNEAFVRLRGRSIAIRVESSATGVQWRLGTPRIEIRADGRR